MTTTHDRTPRHLAPRAPSRLGKNLMTTLPLVLVGSMAVSMNLTGPLDTNAVKRTPQDKPGTPGEFKNTIRDALARAHAATPPGASAADASVDGASADPEAATVTLAAAPSTYAVKLGDTVSAIAARYGLSTASVLALNGLGWKSIIYPGQVLTLSKNGVTPLPSKPSTPTSSQRYKIVSGDTIGKIAARFGVSTQSVLTANGLS